MGGGGLYAYMYWIWYDIFTVRRVIPWKHVKETSCDSNNNTMRWDRFRYGVFEEPWPFGIPLAHVHCSLVQVGLRHVVYVRGFAAMPTFGEILYFDMYIYINTNTPTLWASIGIAYFFCRITWGTEYGARNNVGALSFHTHPLCNCIKPTTSRDIILHTPEYISTTTVCGTAFGHIECNRKLEPYVCKSPINKLFPNKWINSGAQNNACCAIYTQWMANTSFERRVEFSVFVHHSHRAPGTQIIMHRAHDFIVGQAMGQSRGILAFTWNKWDRSV